jgi:hypothetical protein
VGGRFDYMFGTDTRYTQATGNWDMGLMSKNSYYNMALPQAYAEVFAPIGNGLSGKFGHFYSIIGYESVPSPLNFFSSHSYSFKSSPFTTTGALFSYALNEQWGLNFGAVTGPDNFNRDLGAWSQMSGLTWTNAKTGTTASFSVLSGDVYAHQSSQLVYYSAILQQNLGKWHLVLQHDREPNRMPSLRDKMPSGIPSSNISPIRRLILGDWVCEANGFGITTGSVILLVQPTIMS